MPLRAHPDLPVYTCRSGSRTAEPSGGSERSAGAGAASWRSTGCTGPWCGTPSPCPSPSSSPPRTVSWTPVPHGCWVRAHILLGALPLRQGEWAPWRRGQSPGTKGPGHSSLQKEGPPKQASSSPLGGSKGRLDLGLGIHPLYPPLSAWDFSPGQIPDCGLFCPLRRV